MFIGLSLDMAMRLYDVIIYYIVFVSVPASTVPVNMKQGNETGGGMRMFRKALQQRNWQREPLTRIITKITMLHNIKQQRRTQKRT